MTNNTEEVIPLSPPPKNKDANNSSFSSLTTPNHLLRLRSPRSSKNNVTISRGDIDDDDTKKAAADLKCTFSKKKIGIVSSIVVLFIVVIAAVATSNNGSTSKQPAINNAVSVPSNAAIEDSDSTPAADGTPTDVVTPTIATVDTQDTINNTTAANNNSSLTVADIAGSTEEKKSEYASSSSGFGFNLLPSSSWGNSHKPKSGKESKATETTSAKSAKDNKTTSGKASKKDRDGDRDEPDDGPTPTRPPSGKYRYCLMYIVYIQGCVLKGILSSQF